MKHVLMRLQEYQKQASASENNVICFLLNEVETASELSVHELARRTFSSPSTVIRLCKKIGFRGYKDFRKAFLYEAAIRKESGMKQMEEIRREDSLEEIVNKVTVKNILSQKIDRLFSEEAENICHHAVDRREKFRDNRDKGYHGNEMRQKADGLYRFLYFLISQLI